MSELRVGDRVVVRYRLGADAPADWRSAPNPAPVDPASPSMSDVTGVLLSVDDGDLRIDRDGTVVEVPAAAVVSARTLSRRVVRNSEIRDVERALCAAAPALERAEIAGWIVQAAAHRDGSDALRANAAVPVEFGAGAGAVDEIRDWYADRDLPALAVLPDRLVRPGAIPVSAAESRLEVLVTDTPGLPGVLEVDADAPEAVAARADGYELHHTSRAVRL